MILVDSLLYKIDQKLNKLSTNEHQSIPLEDKILAINEAQITLIKQKFSGTVTNTGLGMDGSQKRYEDLQGLVENYIDHPLVLTEKDPNLHQWVASLKDINPSYLFYVDSYLIASKGKCKDRHIWVNQDLAKHADIQILLENVHYKPSFEHQETFTTISSDEIAVYTDGTFEPSKLYLSYIRYPKYIDKEGYINIEGKSSVNQDCELEYYLENELVDLAVQNLAMYTENIAAVQTSQVRLQSGE